MPYLRLQDRDRDLYYTWTLAPASESHHGPPSPYSLVFIHGLGSSSSFFAPVIPALASAGFSCLALDSHGSGLTRYTGRDGGIQQIVSDVGEAISILGLSPSRSIVVGHSMGGIVASEVALRHEMAGAVLLGPVYPNASLANVSIARVKLVGEKGMDAIADVVPNAAPGPKATPTQRAFIRALLLSQDEQGYMSNCRAIADANPPEYSRIKCPLLILAGSHDQTCPMHTSQTILDSWGCADVDKRIQVLDQVGHWHCIEAAEEVGAAILEFASDLVLEG